VDSRRTYRLIGPDGGEILSPAPGALARWIAKGHYVRQRVFFADEPVRELHAGRVPRLEAL